jgi:hypothetical protein
VLTENGVFEIKTNSVTHAGTEKIRRAELFACYQQLGSIFLPEEILYATNRHTILKLVVIKISAPYLNIRLFIRSLVYVKCLAIL